ncbi:ABC transporter substrate-binding protein [Gryllotalpicola ginsengisoli]|uniref:ABC transporter substrate-binding protein n=1 Tax=Gryllotalpicola ginsengisoli TaxID=444608 RepID=UPI0003B4CEE8|nr:ABC transporter substrate-binding protein [Gryllotalpicola ginsengisoli]
MINFYQLIYRTLTTFSSKKGEGSKVVPDLATDMGQSNADATVWTFHLKKNIYFSTGAPITSKDVKFGVERAFDPKLAVGAPYARLYLDAPKDYEGPYKSGDLSSIETPDDSTIVFHLNQSVPEFASALTEPVFTPFPDDPDTVTETSVDQKPVSSGPYEVKSYTQGSSIALVRNPYWKASTDSVRKAYPDKIDFTFGVDAATVDQRLISDQGKDVDTISGNSVLPSSLAKLQTPQLKSRVVEGESGCTTYLVMNTTKPGLNNVKVRQAISYAINKQQVVDAAGGNQLATITNTMLPSNTPGYQSFDLYPSKDSKGDPAKAKELLKAAGVSNLSLILDTRETDTMISQSEAIQQALAKVGITVKINQIDAASFYQTIGTTSEQHDMTVTGWCPDWASGSTFLPPLFQGSQIFSQGNSNVAQLNDPAVNAQIEKIEKMTDLTEANKAWSALDKQINELAPTVPLYYAKAVSLVGSNVGGAYSDPQRAGGVNFATVGLLDPSK